MNYTVTSSEDGHRILLSGELTIEHSGELKDILLNSIEEASSVVVDLQEVTDVDLTALQLFCSAHRTAADSKKKFALVRKGVQVFERVVEDAGYDRHKGCVLDPDDSCIWMKEE